MEWALGSEQKIDDTVTYKIILNNASYLVDHSDRKNRFIEELMKMGNIAFERYTNPFISICPTCENDVIDKDGGLFCPVCNDWFLSPPL